LASDKAETKQLTQLQDEIQHSPQPNHQQTNTRCNGRNTKELASKMGTVEGVVSRGDNDRIELLVFG